VKTFLIIVLGLALFSCSSDEPTPKTNDPQYEDPLEGLPDKGPVRFDNPEIGQRSYYTFFEATEDNSSHEVSFNYTADTLVLAITGQESGKWIVKEFLTQASNSKTSDDGYWSSVPDSVIVRYLEFENDSVYFSKPTEADPFSFVFVGNKITLPLSPVDDPAPLNPDCLPMFGLGSTIWMQYTVNYSQHGQTFDHLNNYFDYRAMTYDGLGFMYAYEPSYGIVRWTWVSYWSWDQANGWDLIPK